MQVDSIFDDFNSRRSMYTQASLSSEMVRPVFQRGSSHPTKFDDDATERRGKRSFSPESWRDYPPTKRSSTTDTTLPRHSPSTFTKHTLSMTSSTCKVETKTIRRKTERRREQCRANQARYRMKQLNHAKLLEETVQHLRGEIPVLELQRNRLMHGGGQKSVWSAVVEYFNTFRFGVPVTPEGQLSSTDVKRVGGVNSNDQLVFLRSTMASNVILGEMRGVKPLMEQWRRYSSFFGDLYFQLESMQRASDTFVMVSATLNATVSESTLANVFPHLSSGGDVKEHQNAEATAEGGESMSEDEFAMIVTVRSKLLGRRLVVPCSLCFEWDPTSCRVTRLETTTNFIAPLTRALRSLDDAAWLMERARISPDGAIGLRERSVGWQCVWKDSRVAQFDQ